MRQAFLIVVLFLMSMIAAFEFGIIYHGKSAENTNNRLRKVEERQTDIIGTLESHHAILRGIGKGRMPQIPDPPKIKK